MTFHRARHLGLQWLRHGLRVAVVLLLAAVAYLSLYAHYRAARALEDDTQLRGVNGHVLRAIDRGIGERADLEAVLDGAKGTLWSMRVAGIDVSDPLAGAEMTATARTLHWPLLRSCLLLVLLSLLAGRLFCSWACPAGLLFEVAHGLRALLRLAELKPGAVRFAHANKYVVLAVGLLIGLLSGGPFFALLYPPAVVSRLVHASIFGTALAGMLGLLGAIVAVEVFVSPRWWCRTMCPGGALYGLLGWRRLLRVRLKPHQCTGCRDCEPACPMGLYPVREASSIECDNCLVCVGHCPTRALYVTLGTSSRPVAKRYRGREAGQAGPRPAAVALLGAAAILLGTAPAAAHHILGLPHYSYKENYPQAPTLEYPATTGPYDVLLTSYPGQPSPGEPAHVTFYIKHRASAKPYDRTVNVRVLQTFTFGRNRAIVQPTSIEPFDALHKLTVTFPDDGEYIVELTMDVEGQAEVIPFLIVAGAPSATVSSLLALGVGLAIVVIVIRAVRVKRDRRAGGGAPGAIEAASG